MNVGGILATKKKQYQYSDEMKRCCAYLNSWRIHVDLRVSFLLEKVHQNTYQRGLSLSRLNPFSTTQASLSHELSGREGGKVPRGMLTFFRTVMQSQSAIAANDSR